MCSSAVSEEHIPSQRLFPSYSSRTVVIDCSLLADKCQVLARRFVCPSSCLTHTAARTRSLSQCLQQQSSSYCSHAVVLTFSQEPLKIQDLRKVHVLYPDVIKPTLSLCIARDHPRDQNYSHIYICDRPCEN